MTDSLPSSAAPRSGHRLHTRTSSAFKLGRVVVLCIASASASAVMVGLLFLAFSPGGDSSAKTALTSTELANNLDNLGSLADAPQPQVQKASERDAALSKGKGISAVVTGVAQSYNEVGELVDVEGIKPHTSQVEQGIDDKSGLTYPCVFGPDDIDVCQRYLTQSEASKNGFIPSR